MVTKPVYSAWLRFRSSVLAKIFMVTKQRNIASQVNNRSVLAKIFMVTKPQKYGSTFLNVIEY